MAKRQFAMRSALNDDVVVMGTQIGKWNETLTGNFVESLPAATSVLPAGQLTTPLPYLEIFRNLLPSLSTAVAVAAPTFFVGTAVTRTVLKNWPVGETKVALTDIELVQTDLSMIDVPENDIEK